MARKLTEREMRKVERWARANKTSELLDFLAELPRRVEIPKPTLFGSRQGQDRFIQGYANIGTLIRETCSMDDAYSRVPSADSDPLLLQKRHDRPEVPLNRAIALGKGTQPLKVCLAAHLGGCSAQIVKAHSIQRSELLKHARSDGHVYGFLFAGAADHRNFPIPQHVGINLVTTFTGVCSRHDAEIFRPIETAPFTAARDQLFLYHYRAVLFGHYLRTHYARKVERMHDELRRSESAEAFEHITHDSGMSKLDQREVAAEKAECDRAHVCGNTSRMLLTAWTADGPPTLAGTVFFGPHKDFSGVRLQPSFGRMPMEWVSLTITPKDERSLIIIGANRTHSTAEQLIRSLEAIREVDRMDALISYSLCVMEQFALLPPFWENLNGAQREAIIRTSHARFYPRRLPRLSDAKLVRIA